MKVLILGATGGVGRHLVSQALAEGHEVTALVRDPAKLGAESQGVRVLKGDAVDPASVWAAVSGQDAVLYALGTRDYFAHTTLFSDSTRLLINAMQQHGARRLVAITGIGAGDSRGHGNFVNKWIVFPLLTRRIYRDKDRQEDMIRHSGLDWVVVRPTTLTEGPRQGNLRAATDLKGVTIAWVSRADVAAFALEQLTSDRYLHQTPLIGY